MCIYSTADVKLNGMFLPSRHQEETNSTQTDIYKTCENNDTILNKCSFF